MTTSALAIPIGVGLLWAIDAVVSRSSSFNDRRRLWSYLWNVSSGHRWVGYGFGSFWKDDANVAPISTPDFRWDAAHNSFVEIYIGMGLTGLIAIVTFLVIAVWSIYVGIHSSRTLASYLPAMIFAFLFVENLSESMILYNSSIWVVFIAIAFYHPLNHDAKPIENYQFETQISNSVRSIDSVGDI